jgi:hypothetical protein
MGFLCLHCSRQMARRSEPAGCRFCLWAGKIPAFQGTDQTYRARLRVKGLIGDDAPTKVCRKHDRSALPLMRLPASSIPWMSCLLLGARLESALTPPEVDNDMDAITNTNRDTNSRGTPSIEASHGTSLWKMPPSSISLN